MAIATAYEAALAADAEFEAAVQRAGYKSRWDWQGRSTDNDLIGRAFRAKVAADDAMHRAFEAARKSEVA